MKDNLRDAIDFLPAGEHDARPFLHDDGTFLSMHFSIGEIQSRMRHADPVALELDYTRTMLGALLFDGQPESALMIGLGGGSLAKYVRAHFAAARITAVEINPHVISLRDAFRLPPDDERLRVLCDDGAAFLRDNNGRRFDVLWVDGFSYDGQSPALCTQAFYDDCRAAVGRDGVMVVNLHAGTPEADALVGRMAHSFEAEPVVVTAADGGNRIVFAASQATLDAAARNFLRRWAALPLVHQKTLKDACSRLARSLQRSLKRAARDR